MRHKGQEFVKTTSAFLYLTFDASHFVTCFPPPSSFLSIHICTGNNNVPPAENHTRCITHKSIFLLCIINTFAAMDRISFVLHIENEWVIRM